MAEWALPAAPDGTPILPESYGFLVFEEFQTLNTKPPRPAIQDGEMFWCDGFMPFGPSNLKVLPGVGSAIYTAPTGKTITAYWFYNLADTSYAAVMLSDGSLSQVDITTLITLTILPAGTLTSPTANNVGVSQWSSKYLVIASDQDNGYWLWDGAVLYSSGGLGPDTTITNSGRNYTSPPTVTFRTTSTSYVAPTFEATVTNGFVTSLKVLTPGSGFLVADLVAVEFSGGGSDTTATAIANISPNSGPIIQGNVFNGGNGRYLATDYPILSGGGGGINGSVALIGNSGTIQAITIITGGKGYTSAPSISIGISTGSKGADFTGSLTVGFGEIFSITVSGGGSGYKSPPDVIIEGDGTGAQGLAVIDPSGAVTEVIVTHSGYGYTYALIKLRGGNNAAEADVLPMPFGISGTAIETYQQRVWVANQKKVLFSATESASNFKPSDGAGVVQNIDSFQRRRYFRLLSTNGFLYLMSDSSVNYISGVQTQVVNNQAATIFNNININPQIGTPWPSSVQPFSQFIVFANSFGIYFSAGSSVQKISEPLDGFYNSVVGQGTEPVIYPSSAIASVFGIQVYMLLLPVIDQITGSQTNKLLMWDGKRWWTSGQDISLTYVASLEINSVLTAYGTDGSSIYPLFQNPSDTFTKSVRSKLWATPSYWFTKTALEIAGLITFDEVDGAVSVVIDSETGSSDPISVTAAGVALWVNDSNVTVTWQNNSAAEVDWGGHPGLVAFDPETTQNEGALLGFTVTTSTKSATILSLAMLGQNYQPRFS